MAHTELGVKDSGAANPSFDKDSLFGLEQATLCLFLGLLV